MYAYKINTQRQFIFRENRVSDRQFVSRERKTTTVRSLSGLSDNKLIAWIKKIGITERKTLISALRCLNEIERRELYLSQGYNSLYDFCVRSLRYSESSALRRIRTARCLRDYPKLRAMLLSGEVNVSSISKISVVLNTGNSAKLFSEIAGRSAREVDAIVATYRPRSRVPDRVRPVFVMSEIKATDKSVGKFTSNVGGKKSGGERREILPEGGISETDEHRHTRSESLGNVQNVRNKGDDRTEISGNRGRRAGRSDSIATRVAMTKRFKLEFGVDPAFMDKLEKVRSLLSTKHPRRLEFERLFEILMDEYLERHDPHIKNRKRVQKAQTGNTKKIRHHGRPKENESRHIPDSLRDRVFERDGGRCTYKGPDGKRCGSRRNLQVDHIIPYARGGKHTLSNLRLLCAKHNRLEAEREYGKEFIKRHIKKE
jgi:5-methylcytosine-specific restriction endonuclease McrA